MLRSPAIYMINHYNDIFVEMKKGELGEAGQPDGEEREWVDQYQRRRSTGVSQLLFVGMLAGQHGGHPPRANPRQHTRIQ